MTVERSVRTASDWVNFRTGQAIPAGQYAGTPLPAGVRPDATNVGVAGVGLTRDDVAANNTFTGFGAWSEPVSFDMTYFLWSNLGSGGVLRMDPGGHFYASRSYFECNLDNSYDPWTNTSITLEDCTVDGAEALNAIGFRGMTLRRCNIFNGTELVNVGPNMVMEDCYLHGLYLAPDRADHCNPVFHGGGGNLTIRNCVFEAQVPNNSLDGGVSTALSLFPDFSPVHDVLVENCLIKWTTGGYGCSLGWNPGKAANDDPLNATNITFRNNVFEKGPSGQCGVYGPVTSWNFAAGTGNVWENNLYDDGTVVDPA